MQTRLLPAAVLMAVLALPACLSDPPVAESTRIGTSTPSEVEYRRAFDLPAVPTLTLRMEF